MAISYPLSLPSVSGIRSISISAVHATGYSGSPFTMAGQSFEWPGQMWQASISLPAMTRPKADEWNAFLISLRGRVGSFLLGDPLATSLRGTASSCLITGTAGASTVSANVPLGETLLRGDYIQIGSAGSARLHKVMVDFTGTGANADLEIFPSIRTTVSSVAAVLSNTKGLFRLTDNTHSWNESRDNLFTMSFDAMEFLS